MEREEKGVGGDQQAKKEMAEGIREMMTCRKTRRTRSETQVWEAFIRSGSWKNPDFTSAFLKLERRLRFFKS